jgi:hypothetical protein
MPPLDIAAFILAVFAAAEALSVGATVSLQGSVLGQAVGLLGESDGAARAVLTTAGLDVTLPLFTLTPMKV